MAVKKRSTRTAQPGSNDPLSLPPGSPVRLPENPEAVRKLAELGIVAGRHMRLRIEAEDVARVHAKEYSARERKRYCPSRETVQRVSHRLNGVGLTLLAIHDAIPEMQERAGASGAEWPLVLFSEACRSAFLAVDACMGALDGSGLVMGNFHDHLALAVGDA